MIAKFERAWATTRWSHFLLIVGGGGLCCLSCHCKAAARRGRKGFHRGYYSFWQMHPYQAQWTKQRKARSGFFLFVIVFLHLAGRTCVRMYLGIFSFSIGVYINTLHTYLGVRIGSEKQMETNLSGCCTRILPICPLSVPNVVTYLRACTSEMHSAFSSLQP